MNGGSPRITFTMNSRYQISIRCIRKNFWIFGILAVIVIDRIYALQRTWVSETSIYVRLFSESPMLQFLTEVIEKLENYLQKHEKLFMVGGTLAVAVFTWTLYRTARDQLHASNTALRLSERSVKATEQTIIASQRPWISVEVGLAGPLTVSNTEVRVDLGLTLRNVGKSPAINSEIHLKLVNSIDANGDLWTTEAINFKNEVKQRISIKNSSFGTVIFPGEIQRQPIGASISIEELKRNALPTMLSTKFIGLVVIGYVAYRNTFDESIHLTHFNGTIGKPRPDNPKVHIMLNYDDKHLEPGQYGIWINPFFGGNAD